MKGRSIPQALIRSSPFRCQIVNYHDAQRGLKSECLHAVKAADVAHGLVAIAGGLLDGAAQPAELVGLPEQPAPFAFLLECLVRSHRPRKS
jgi:hypothetical protein